MIPVQGPSLRFRASLPTLPPLIPPLPSSFSSLDGHGPVQSHTCYHRLRAALGSLRTPSTPPHSPGAAAASCARLSRAALSVASRRAAFSPPPPSDPYQSRINLTPRRPRAALASHSPPHAAHRPPLHGLQSGCVRWVRKPLNVRDGCDAFDRRARGQQRRAMPGARSPGTDVGSPRINSARRASMIAVAPLMS